MFQVFHTYISTVSSKNVVYVAMTIYTCCKRIFHVASMCFKCFRCFRRMFQVFHLDVANVAVAIYACCKRMFHVINICFKCFRRMFHLDVAIVYLDVT